MVTDADMDLRVRRHAYDVTMRRGLPPAIAQLTAELSLPGAAVRQALQRLASARALVLQPESGEILMANPFSAVPTPFLVETPSYSCYGSCVWDALGIAAMLRCDSRIRTACGDCGLALGLEVASGQVRGDASVVHFAIPARHWWDDIVFN